MVVYNGRCGVPLDAGMANMWRRGGERRHDSLDGRFLAIVVPCACRALEVVSCLLFRYMGPFEGQVLIRSDDGCSFAC